MSELITLIHSETDTRRLQKTQEDSTPKWIARCYQVGPVGPNCRPPGPLGPTCQSLW